MNIEATGARLTNRAAVPARTFATAEAELDEFVDTLASRIASFDKLAIGNTKRLVNAASLPPDVEIDAGWQACMASILRPAAQEKIKALMARGFHKPGDLENRLGYYLGQPRPSPPAF